MSKTLLQAVLKTEIPDATPIRRSAIVDAIFDAFTRELAISGRLLLPGTGALVVRVRPKRIGRNPATGEQLELPSKAFARFTPAQRLVRALNPPDAAIGDEADDALADGNGDERKPARR